MQIKTLTWNVGGCYTKSLHDPNDKTFNIKNIKYVIDIIGKENPDIVTLQEVHGNFQTDQTQEICMKLNYKYAYSDLFEKSHLERGQQLGHGIISKFEILGNYFIEYKNPNLTTQRNGQLWKTHKKGVSKCKLKIDNKFLSLKNTHILPLKHFGFQLNSSEMEELREDIVSKIKPVENIELLQGDFNFSTKEYKNLFPQLITDGLNQVEIKNSTAADGTDTDFILYKGLKFIETHTILDVLTDRFPTICVFEI